MIPRTLSTLSLCAFLAASAGIGCASTSDTAETQAPGERSEMEHAEQVRLLKVLMAHLDNDTNVDAGGMRRNPSQARSPSEGPAGSGRPSFAATSSPRPS